jgi:hypothetical protein
MKKRFPKSISLGIVMTTLMSIIAPGVDVMAESEPIWYDCLTREMFTPEKQTWCARWQTLQNAAYTVPTNLDPDPEYTTVILENGRYQQEDGRFIVELVNQKGWIAFGDINNDGKEDAAVIFGVALDPDGRAVATYLTAVLDIDAEAQVLTPVKLGERIMLGNAVTIENSRITVPFLTATEVINRAYGVDGATLSELQQSCKTI